MQGEEEAFFSCPYCGSAISMVLDVYSGGQSYIEDCEVCCQPVEVSYQVVHDTIHRVDVKRLDD